MSFQSAIKTCFRKFVTFSGRASRSEYWYFVLFLILASAVLGVVDRALFGNPIVESSTVAGVEVTEAQADGPLASLFSLITLLPLLAAGWRRMHDSGRSGLFLIYPILVMVGIGTFAGVSGALGQFATGAIAGGVSVVMILAIIVLIISPLLVLWWLTRPSEPGPNEYGPNPHEVTP